MSIEEGSLVGSGEDKGGPSNEERLELRTAERRGHQAGKGRCAAGRGRPAKAASTEERMRQHSQSHNQDSNLNLPLSLAPSALRSPLHMTWLLAVLKEYTVYVGTTKS